jgi:ribosome maturation factor RimP
VSVQFGQREVEAICERMLAVPEFRDLEVLKCTAHKERRVYYVRIIVDRESGVDSNLCEAVSRYVENRIEELPPPVPLFQLEVASAGLARPLLRPEHFARFRGREINVITTLRIKNRVEFTGAISHADATAVTVDDRYAGPTPLPYAAIKRANLVYDPREDLKKKTHEERRR